MILIVIMVAALIANFFWFSFIKSEAVEITEIKTEIQKERAEVYNPVELKNKILDLEDRNAKINDIFIDKSNIVVFIEEIEKLAVDKNVSLEIQRFDIDPVTVTQGEREVELHGLLDAVFKIDGSWPAVNEFLYAIETQPHHLRVKSLRLVSDNSSSGWSASFSLEGITN